MLRSLFAAVSGLSTNIVELDVVGNNISNVNTVGFKQARVTFQEILTQNLKPATRPVSGGLGGTNPQQIGLGTVVASIDSQFSQGNLRTTGGKTDLAIQGDGFFILSDGRSQSYTRAGNFTFDANNFLVDASTGKRVQGLLADVNGTFLSGANGDLQIDPSTVVPAKASSEVKVFGNLSSKSDAVGTHLVSKGAFLAIAQGGSSLLTLHGSVAGNDLNIGNGNKVSLTGLVNGIPITSQTFEVGVNGTTVTDLVGFMQNGLVASGAAGVTATLQPDGTISINNGGATSLQNLKLEIGGAVDFNQTMLFNDVPAGGTSVSAGALLTPATRADTLDSLYNAAGKKLNIAFDPVSNQTVLQVGGTRGGEAITSLSMLATRGVTTLGDLLDRITDAFAISNAQGVSVTNEGFIDVVGDTELRNSLDNISIQEPKNDVSNLSTSFDFRTLAAAQDAKTYSVTTTVYDSLGDTHNLTLNFTKRTGFNIWDWKASLDKGEEVLNGETGTVTFDEKGSLVSFLYTDGGGQISFRPQATGTQGAEVVNLAVNPGTTNGVNGLTQFAPADQLQSLANGYTVGRLSDFDIDRRGVISGRFSNDTVLALARIAISRFSNPNGLVRVGNNSFTISGNSGQAIFGFAGEGSAGEINPGALEASNVDLAEQFTRLVVAQRAFQANARVITTGDRVLQDLVNIV
jgi:flagellar hook protein FlgE